ncbi:MAG: hypothetical protein GY841_18675 [FCB group bacterium]|nr:hypothetical protein [FCB group bacterium]
MAQTKIIVTEREDETPICPYCEKELAEVYTRSKGLGWLEGKNAICFCPHCKKVLGFGQSRMM